MAKLRAFLHQLPELLLVPFCAASHIHQIDGDHTLIEAAIVLVTAVRVQASGIWGQKSPTSHAAVDIALQLLHHLGADIVRDHAPGRAPCSQHRQIPVRGILGDVVLVQHIDELGECGRNPDANFILNPLVTLTEAFRNDQG